MYTFNLISNLVTDCIQERKEEPSLFSVDYDLSAQFKVKVTTWIGHRRCHVRIAKNCEKQSKQKDDRIYRFYTNILFSTKVAQGLTVGYHKTAWRLLSDLNICALKFYINVSLHI